MPRQNGDDGVTIAAAGSRSRRTGRSMRRSGDGTADVTQHLTIDHKSPAFTWPEHRHTWTQQTISVFTKHVRVISQSRQTSQLASYATVVICYDSDAVTSAINAHLTMCRCAELFKRFSGSPSLCFTLFC